MTSLSECRLNPEDIRADRFVIAEHAASGSFLGCGQLAPMGCGNALKLRSLLVEPESRYGGDVMCFYVHRERGLHHQVRKVCIDADEKGM